MAEERFTVVFTAMVPTYLIYLESRLLQDDEVLQNKWALAWLMLSCVRPKNRRFVPLK